MESETYECDLFMKRIKTDATDRDVSMACEGESIFMSVEDRMKYLERHAHSKKNPQKKVLTKLKSMLDSDK